MPTLKNRSKKVTSVFKLSQANADDAVHLRSDAPLPNAAERREPAPGDRMPDGTIFAGVSPASGRRIFVTPEDAPGALPWKAAYRYARDLDAHGHRDWKLPAREELEILYRNRHKGALEGTFNASGRYWSSEALSGFVITGSLADVLASRMLLKTPTDVLLRRFSDGREQWDWPTSGALLRAVRTEPSR